MRCDATGYDTALCIAWQFASRVAISIQGQTQRLASADAAAAAAAATAVAVADTTTSQLLPPDTSYDHFCIFFMTAF
jgi:hypothetical protein